MRKYQIEFTGSSFHVSFPYNTEIYKEIKNISGSFFNHQKKIFIVPASTKNLTVIQNLFSKYDTKNFDHFLSPLKDELILRKYSPKTQTAYLLWCRDFLGFIEKNPKQCSEIDVRKYVLYRSREKNSSASTLNQIISALRFYFNEILKIPIGDISRPRRNKSLPDILSGSEVLQIINSCRNLKHRAVLSLVYSAGLRVSEVIQLKPGDINSERGIVRIRQGKGRKDRISLLSKNSYRHLIEYRIHESNTEWIFPGQFPGTHLSVRSAERIFEVALERSGIPKKLSIHDMRHAFATHLLEQGVDLRYIQSLLGHKSSKTTEIYTHVSNMHLRNIRNPLDRIIGRENIKND